MTRSLMIGVLLGALAVPAMAQDTVPPSGSTGPRPSPTRPTVPPDAGPIGPIDGGTRDGSRKEGSGADRTSPTGDKNKKKTTDPSKKRDPYAPSAPTTP